MEVAAGQDHTCARTSGGAVYCWGNNDSGQVGLGTAPDPLNPDRVSIATLLSGITATQVSAGAFHTCAIANSRVYCWGDNSFLQTGQSGAGPILNPTQVSGITDAVEVAAGGFHTCVRRATGAVICWGNNESGERGDAFPAAPGTSLVTVSGLSASALTASRGRHNCAVGTGSIGYCWGLNDNGRLGNGLTTSNRLPQKLSPLN